MINHLNYTMIEGEEISWIIYSFVEWCLLWFGEFFFAKIELC